MINDGIAVVDWAIKVARIPPERIVIFGQSLGTAVATAVAEHYVLETQLEFAGIILVAGFSDIPTLMTTYTIGGIIPILSPLKPYPSLQRFFSKHIQEQWPSSERLQQFVRQSQNVNLRLIHARNDYNIPWSHSTSLFYAAANGTSEHGMTRKQIDSAKIVEVQDDGYMTWHWSAANAYNNGMKRIKLEIVPYGGKSAI